MEPLEDLEQDYPIMDSNFRMFCASHGIFTDEDFLVHDLYALEGFAGQGYAPEKLKQGIKQVFSIIENQHQPWLNGLELLEDAQLNKCTLSTGCERIDVLLQGGLRKGHLTELVGQSSSCLILQGNLFLAIDFVSRHNDCFIDIVILSTVATISQFFISYTIRNFGALAFATIMTTRQLVSILLSCVWFAHPLSAEQLIGAVIVFGSIYSKSYFRSKPKPLPSEQTEGRAMSPTRSTA